MRLKKSNLGRRLGQNLALANIACIVLKQNLFPGSKNVLTRGKNIFCFREATFSSATMFPSFSQVYGEKNNVDFERLIRRQNVGINSIK